MQSGKGQEEAAPLNLWATTQQLYVSVMSEAADAAIFTLGHPGDHFQKAVFFSEETTENTVKQPNRCIWLCWLHSELSVTLPLCRRLHSQSPAEIKHTLVEGKLYATRVLRDVGYCQRWFIHCTSLGCISSHNLLLNAVLSVGSGCFVAVGAAQRDL